MASRTKKPSNAPTMTCAGKWRWVSKWRRGRFAKSTLQEFRAQLILHEQKRALFQRSLEVAKHRGVWKKGRAPDERQHIKLALDTTYILGRGAVRDTYHLLADGIVQVLRGLAKLVECELLEVAEELGWARDVQGPSLKGQAAVDWTAPQARQRFLAEIVDDAEQLLAVVRGTRSELPKTAAKTRRWWRRPSCWRAS
jgi:hypothetical protein